MNLLLIRHGESTGNASGRLQGQADWPLNDRGRSQAQALAARLLREGTAITALYASDLSRAVETAEILARPLQLALIQDRRLREYDAGVLNGIVWREVEFLYPEVWKAYHEAGQWANIPGEEGDQAFHNRLAGFLADLQAHHGPDDSVVAVSHGGALAVLVAQLVGLPPGKRQPFRFANASLTLFEFGERGPVLVRANDTCHLDGDPGLRAWSPPTSKLPLDPASAPEATHGAPEAW